eukprot:TRINITY_DN9211_c0_g1_i3.p1 TRINITY_DN9211_c0_g1~~TRINITY_DN9211_c0_g1_i3.p1  ORF type:complete len:407 (+),score=103.47 TRINITY_DN9211_c0_g1_i3:332-1552(+)
MRVVFLWNLDFQNFLINKFHNQLSLSLDHHGHGLSLNDRLQLWYFKHRKFFAMPFFSCLGVLAEFDVVINSYLLNVSQGSWNVPHGTALCDKIWASGSSRTFIRWAIIVVLLFSMLYSMRKLNDNFGLMKEVKTVLLLGFLLLVYVLIGSQIPGMFSSAFHFILFGFIFEMLWLCLTVLPAILWARKWAETHPVVGSRIDSTFTKEKSSQAGRSSTGRNARGILSRLLQHEDGFKMFYTFLEKEFALENILFWKTAEEFHVRFDDNLSKALNQEGTVKLSQNVLAEASLIMQRYINDDAVLCVNLSSECRQEVYAKFAILSDLEAHPTRAQLTKQLNELLEAFQRAQREVLKLLSLDSFMRFRETSSFKEFAVKNLMDGSTIDEGETLISTVAAIPNGDVTVLPLT